MTLVMNIFLWTVTLMALATPSNCNVLIDDLHHYDATEWDVESPQIDPCRTSFGSFGRRAKYDQPFSYTYELQLIDGEYLQEALRVDPINSDGQTPEGLRGVFSAIETAIADELLASDVFDSVCNGGTVRGPYKRGGERKLRPTTNKQYDESRRMRAVGISSEPDEQILEGVSCRQHTLSNETGTGPCFVVDGGLVVYLDIYEDLETTLSGLVEYIMNEKRILDDVHPYIMSVRFVELEAEGSPNPNQEELEGERQDGGSSTLRSSVYALLAAGSFIVVGTAILYRRRRRAAEHDGETSTPSQLPQSQL